MKVIVIMTKSRYFIKHDAYSYELAPCNYCICTVHLPGDGGVFATKHIRRGEFLLQYAGEHIPGMEARRREKHYQKGRRCYMCLYHHNDQEYG